MNKAKKIASFVIIIFAVFFNVAMFLYQKNYEKETVDVKVTLSTPANTSYTLYYNLVNQPEDKFYASQIVTQSYTAAGSEQELTFSIPVTAQQVRFDLTEGAGVSTTVYSISVMTGDTVIESLDMEEESISINNGADITTIKNGYEVITTDVDSYVVWDVDSSNWVNVVAQANANKFMVKKIITMVAVDLLLLYILLHLESVLQIPVEVFREKKLIGSLAKNDFKTKFAGSYLGIIWAFVQPIVTVVVYWFVFQKALNVGTQATKAGLKVPYVLWLVAGLVPWFYFSDLLSTGTSVLLEYSYLVKKVVFNISSLPLVKAISNLFVHLFFLAFTLILYSCYSYFPSVYMLQMIYYSFAMMVLALGLIYLTSAISVFFRDLAQIVAILLQIGVWFTPIMWNIDAMILSAPVTFIMKLNPMYYIVMGYRDSLINQVWFWENPFETIYFWTVTIIIFIFGTSIFRKLKIHFADVL